MNGLTVVERIFDLGCPKVREVPSVVQRRKGIVGFGWGGKRSMGSLPTQKQLPHIKSSAIDLNLSGR
jgi:hypothetical protein